MMERAFQAVQLSNAFVLLARNAMENAQAANQLNFRRELLPSFAELKAFFADKYDLSGKQLYQKIIDQAKNQLKRPEDPCFVAGTLVHTKEGLKPIEQIKVGDYVLSKPESGEGEQSYQRVVKTFEHEDQEVYCVDVIGWTAEEREHAQATRTVLDQNAHFPIVVTANHPFWVVGKGWVEVRDLTPGVDQLLLADGSLRDIRDLTIVVKTAQTDIGWLVGGWINDPSNDDGLSREIDFRNGVHTQYGYRYRVPNDAIEWLEISARIKRTVYNLEVENTHTYYVGEKGVWVHNKHTRNTEDFDVTLQEVRNDIIPPYGNRVYWNEGDAYAKAYAPSKNQVVGQVAFTLPDINIPQMSHNRFTAMWPIISFNL